MQHDINFRHILSLINFLHLSFRPPDFLGFPFLVLLVLLDNNISNYSSYFVLNLSPSLHNSLILVGSRTQCLVLFAFPTYIHSFGDLI